MSNVLGFALSFAILCLWVFNCHPNRFLKGSHKNTDSSSAILQNMFILVYRFERWLNYAVLVFFFSIFLPDINSQPLPTFQMILLRSRFVVSREPVKWFGPTFEMSKCIQMYMPILNSVKRKNHHIASLICYVYRFCIVNEERETPTKTFQFVVFLNRILKFRALMYLSKLLGHSTFGGL